MRHARGVLKAAVVVAAAVAPGVGRLEAQLAPIGSSGLQYVGGTGLLITGIDKNAADRSTLYLFNAANLPAYNAGPAGTALGLSLFDNYTNVSNVSGEYATLNGQIFLSNATLAAYGITPGSEIVFGIYDQNANLFSFTGADTRNGPTVRSQAFVSTTPYPTYTACTAGSWTCVVRMEDRNPNPDLYDLNDFVFQVTATPEPASMALMATGLFGVAGVGAFKRRKAAA